MSCVSGQDSCLRCDHEIHRRHDLFLCIYHLSKWHMMSDSLYSFTSFRTQHPRSSPFFYVEYWYKMSPLYPRSSPFFIQIQINIQNLFNNLNKGTVGLILVKASGIRISIPLDLSSRPFIPPSCFIRSRCQTPLLAPSVTFFPPCSD